MQPLLDRIKTRLLFEALGIKSVNPGACTGPDGWISDPNGKKLVSYNPTTGEELAQVIQAGPAVYEQVSAAAQAAFQTWRSLPAPKRGLLVRDLGQALRAKKEPWAIWFRWRWARSRPKATARCRR
jgi:aldehyde dehydrogenase (NAD+)